MKNEIERINVEVDQLVTNFVQDLESLLATTEIDERSRMYLKILQNLSQSLGQEPSAEDSSDNLERLDPVLVESYFLQAMQAQKAEFENRSGKRPQRVQRLWRAFRGNEGKVLNAEVVAREFSGTKDPLHGARTAISLVNQLFEKLGFDVEITHVTAYMLQKRKR
jgi:hypothetical protein